MHVQGLPSPLLELALQRAQPDEAADPASGDTHGWSELQPLPAHEARDAVVCGVTGCCMHSACLQGAPVLVRHDIYILDAGPKKLARGAINFHQTRQQTRQQAGRRHGVWWSIRKSNHLVSVRCSSPGPCMLLCRLPCASLMFRCSGTLSGAVLFLTQARVAARALTIKNKALMAGTMARAGTASGGTCRAWAGHGSVPASSCLPVTSRAHIHVWCRCCSGAGCRRLSPATGLQSSWPGWRAAACCPFLEAAQTCTGRLCRALLSARTRWGGVESVRVSYLSSRSWFPQSWPWPEPRLVVEVPAGPQRQWAAIVSHLQH